ncbi:hypothetical protein ACN24L_27720 [Streptomyces microflavus]
MRSPKPEGPGRRLELDHYMEDFGRYFWDCDPEGFWKLERRQTFQEPGVESGEAFRRGNPEEALSLLEGQRGH